jgi:hypothetical protein
MRNCPLKAQLPNLLATKNGCIIRYDGVWHPINGKVAPFQTLHHSLRSDPSNREKYHEFRKSIQDNKNGHMPTLGAGKGAHEINKNLFHGIGRGLRSM